MAREHRVAINVGGSIVAPETIDPEFLEGMAEVLHRAADSRDLLIVVGGGRTARKYIEACRALGLPEDRLDLVGIDATRLNARLLIAALGDLAYDDVPTTVEEALEALEGHRAVVMGGTRPGQTTDAVSAQLAVRGGAEELLILTNVDGVYSADPKEDPAAVRLPSLSTAKLLDIVSTGEYAAGSNAVVDPVAAGLIHEAALTTKVLDGRDLAQVASALSGGEFSGTMVIPTG